MRFSTIAGLMHAQSNTAIPNEDGAAVAYLHIKIYSTRSYSHFQQVLVDEVQDLDTLHLTLLANLCPSARFTLLGDVHQTLMGNVNMSHYDHIRSLFAKPYSLLVHLIKSFRFTKKYEYFQQNSITRRKRGMLCSQWKTSLPA